MRNKVLICLVLLSAAATACNNDDSGGKSPPPPTSTVAPTSTVMSPATATTTPTSTPIPQGVVALFSADPLDPDNPFPTNRLLDDGGHVRVPSVIIEKVLPAEPRFTAARNYLRNAATELQSLTGFSIFAPIRVVLDGAAVVDNRFDPSGIFLMRLDAPNQRVPVRVEAVTPEVAGDYAIEIGPMVPLDPETTYVYAVTNTVRDADANPLGAEALFTEILCHTETDGPLSGWRDSLQPAVAELEQAYGVACEDIVMMDSFLTQATADDLITVRDLFDEGTLPYADPVLEDSPVPGLVTGVFVEGTPQFTELVGSPTSDAIASVVVGSFPSYEFRGQRRVFDPARVAGEVVPSINNLDFYVAIPKAPPPPGGYPLVIYGHGLSRSGADAITTANSFPDLPMIWAGISAVSHGRRGNFLNFFNLSNVLATRDNFRQTVADFLQFERMIRHTRHPLFADVNRDRIEYYGVSLGGIIGTLYMGFESDIEVALLNVPGGGLPNILAGSDFIGDLINPLIGFQLGIALDDPIFPVVQRIFLQLAQWTLDPGDPISTAPFLLGPETLPGVPPKRVLMQMGISDTIVPNNTSEDLARAMRIADVKETLGCEDDEGCSGIWRYVMTEYDQPADCGHLISFVLEESHRQALQFLFSNGTEIEDASPRLSPEERPECPDLSEAGL